MPKKLPSFIAKAQKMFDAEVTTPAKYKAEMRKKRGMWVKWENIKPVSCMNPLWWKRRIGNWVEAEYRKEWKERKAIYRWITWTNKCPKPRQLR